MINKMYNPFKWHIATNGVGEFVIRRMGWFSWEYLDRDSDYVWLTPAQIFPCLLAAESVLAFQKPPTKWTYLKS